MREVLRSFRLKVKAIEDRAGSQIDEIMVKPTLQQGNLQQLNTMIIRSVMERSMDALKKGITFGKFVKGKLNDSKG